MSLTTTNLQAPAETMIRSTTSTENEISVLSSRPFRRVQVIAITVIVSGVILLSVVAITASLVISTRGNPEKQQEGPQDVSTTATATRTVTVTATATATTAATAATPIPATTATAITTATAKVTPTTLADVYSWSEWSSWLPHNVTCGYQRRMRKCRLSHSKHHGTYCSGPIVLTRKLTLCRDCKEWRLSGGSRTSGVYTIRPDSLHPFQVYCDMTTDGGGWTVFQRRQDGSEDFNRTWDEYKTGFGNLSGEFWLGNDKIHRLTYDRHQTLRIDMFNAAYLTHYQEVYEEFNISSEIYDYTFYVGNHIRGISGSLRENENYRRFSTTDRDNDGRWPLNTAAQIGGGWWYKYDYYSQSLNGLYGSSRFAWYGYDHYGRLTYCDMKVK